jgi:hypothetical protein
MQSSPAVEAARHFLSVVWEGDTPSDAELSEALDRLVAAYHTTPDADVSDSDLEAPTQDGASLYKEVSERFPDYGLYPVADPSASIGDAMGMGDAIDDLADITLDMREVVWLADQLTLDEAHWAFRLHFFHWGHGHGLPHHMENTPRETSAYISEQQIPPGDIAQSDEPLAVIIL